MVPLTYIRSIVIRGFGRGSRELGCPTANVDNINHLTIPTGIYCGLAQIVVRSASEVQQDPNYPDAYKDVISKLPYTTEVKGMVCSFGFNPHYENTERSLEVHILDNLGFDFYGAELRVLICEKMRDEKKYESLEALKQDIANDICYAKSVTVNFQHHVFNSNYFLKP